MKTGKPLYLQHDLAIASKVKKERARVERELEEARALPGQKACANYNELLKLFLLRARVVVGTIVESRDGDGEDPGFKYTIEYHDHAGETVRAELYRSIHWPDHRQWAEFKATYAVGRPVLVCYDPDDTALFVEFYPEP